MDGTGIPIAWGYGLLGGVMIGLSAALLLLSNGRIAGISGIFGGLLIDRTPDQLGWRSLFLIGLISGPLLAAALGLAQFGTGPSNRLTWVIAGLLVGFGTRLGNGCTSGHGICGLARLSKRSFAATLTFMTFGFITVYALRHWNAP